MILNKIGTTSLIKTYNIKGTTIETFDKNGNKIGTLSGQDGDGTLQGQLYIFSSDNKETPESMTVYKNGNAIQETKYDKKGFKKIQIDCDENGIAIGRSYYDTSGKITSKLTYSEPGREENGLKISDNHVQEFINGKLISDKEFYNTGEVFSDEKADIITYFDKKGKVIGNIIAKQNENQLYKQPYEGSVYSYSSEYDTFNSYRKYKKGVIVEEVKYFLDNHLKNEIKEQKFYQDKLFDPTSAYTNKGIPIKEIQNFENGSKKFEYTDYQGYPSGEFYKIVSFDASGKKTGEYDKKKNEGTQCFYYDQESDDLESIETYKNGKKIYEKKFHQTKNFFGNIITKIDLFEEIFYKE